MSEAKNGVEPLWLKKIAKLTQLEKILWVKIYDENGKIIRREAGAEGYLLKCYGDDVAAYQGDMFLIRESCSDVIDAILYVDGLKAYRIEQIREKEKQRMIEIFEGRTA